MRTVIVGNRKLARYLLGHTLRYGWDVVGALIPAGELAASQANFVPFEEFLADTDCSLHRSSDINSEQTIEWLEEASPDICLCGGWSQIIEDEILSVPERGFLGLHSSRLPEGRGGAPVNWSIINGASEVWISLFYYTSEVDAGDIVAQGSVPVEGRDDVETVFEKLASKACELVSSVRGDLETNSVAVTKQSLDAATYRPRRQPQDGLIDWKRSPTKQVDWVRAQTAPYPGAYTFFEAERLTIWRGEAVETPYSNAKPGEVLEIVDGEGIDVRTGDGAFRIQQVTPGNRPVQWADRYAHDVGLTAGDRFSRDHASTDWHYTGIRGPSKPSTFDTNLSLGDTGSVRAVAYSGSRHELELSATLDGEQIFTASANVTDSHTERITYSPDTIGTHTLAVRFEVEGETSDTRYLKVFVHD